MPSAIPKDHGQQYTSCYRYHERHHHYQRQNHRGTKASTIEDRPAAADVKAHQLNKTTQHPLGTRIRYSPESNRANWPRHTLPGANERKILDTRYEELKDMATSLKGRVRQIDARKEACARSRRSCRRGCGAPDPAIAREKDEVGRAMADVLQLRARFERKAEKLRRDYDAFADMLRWESRYSDRRAGTGCKEARKVAEMVVAVRRLVDESCGILTRR